MDTIADLLTIIRNGYLAKKETVTAGYSKVRHAITNVLHQNGYLEGIMVKDGDNLVKKTLVINLRYLNGIPAIAQIKRISKPSVRVYSSARKLPNSLSGSGISIISTSKGIMTDKQARKENLGGEVICKVY